MRARVTRASGQLALCLLYACGQSERPVLVVPVTPAASAAGNPQAPAARVIASSYTQELATLNGAIDAAMRQLGAQPDNLPLAQETVTLYLERARLSGMLDDYQPVLALLDASTPRARTDADLCQARARLHFALHRLDAAGSALAQCAGTMDPVEAGALAADIALYGGHYAAAEARYRDLVNQVGNSSQYIRLAQYRRKTGAPGEAAALLEAAEKRYNGGSAVTRAWLRLQRGLVAFDQGRLDEALALYRLASDALPGWWMVDEQIAEVLRLQGDAAGARALLESLVAQYGHPEHMDELARLLREGDKPDAALPWIARAQAIYRQRLKSFPEAGVGHAVDHFLQFGAPAEALALARRSAELRPFGDTQIELAAALFRAGRAGEAAALIRRVQDSGWNTPQLYAVAAQIHAALGQNTLADTQRARALAMNRHAMRLYLIPQPVQLELVSLS